MRVYCVNPKSIFVPSVQKSSSNLVKNKHEIADDKILNFLGCQGCYNLAFCSAPSPLYAIDVKTGEYKKYFGINEASRATQANSTCISACLKGKRCTSNGHYFVNASELESINQNGDSVLDEVKLKEKIKQLQVASTPKRTNLPIYSIDKDGNCTKYGSVVEAAKALNYSSDSNISKCATKKEGTCADHVFLYAHEVEIVGKDGKITLDQEKVKERKEALIAAIAKRPVIRPFYAVDENGHSKKFERISDAEKVLNVNHSHINECLNKQADTAGGYVFVYADEAEQIDEKGRVSVHFNISPDVYGQKTPVSMYSIDEFGEIRFHESIAQAEEELGAHARNIFACLTGKRLSANGYAFVRSQDICIKDMGDKVELNGDALEQMFNNVIKYAVYVFDSKGNCRRYKNAQKAAEAIGTTNSNVIQCALGACESVNGCLVAKATSFESVKSGKREVNVKLLEKYSEDAIKLDLSKKVLATSQKTKQKKVYPSAKAASEDLGIPERRITNCLYGKQKATGGYTFTRPKMKEKSKQSKPEKPETIIYSIYKGTDIKSFSSIDEAAESLGLMPDDIMHFLNVGRSKNGKTTLNGYVFATNQDE